MNVYNIDDCPIREPIKLLITSNQIKLLIKLNKTNAQNGCKN